MKLFKLTALLFCCLCTLNVDNALACTNLIVGKKASADGSVIVSYNADNYGMYGDLYHRAAATHLQGEMRKIYEWDTNRLLGSIPEAPTTYNVVGQMNEHQVTVTETTFGGREELVDPKGIIDYGSLMYIALERSKTAREAIQTMTSLVARYGYASEGESFTIADKDEAWIMEMVGKGPGRTGAVWVAVRIPDDCIAAHANQSRITHFNMKDKQNVMYARDVISFAREKGYFHGKDADFSFRDAYCPLSFGNIRYCDARVWSFFNRHTKGMDKYLPYINGEDMKMEMPLYVKPDNPLTVQDVWQGMRDHYEDTPLDIRNDLGAGAYNMPYRPTPLSAEVDGKTYFNERPISTQQTGFSFVGQMRGYLPNVIGGLIWWTNDDANMAAYTPIYSSATDVPECYVKVDGQQDDLTFSWKSAFWLENTVANMVYPYYSKIFPDLEKARTSLEQNYIHAQNRIETEAKTRYESNPEDAKAYLTQYGKQAANDMMTRWEELFKYIVVKHNDMAVKKEENGHFKRTPEGLAEPPLRPGYSKEYWQRIIHETGNRYLSK